jgi:ribosome-associated heat shock protein Hsp15
MIFDGARYNIDLFLNNNLTSFLYKMRIDKYLWCVRYYKTRNMVTEACKKNHITVNGNIAKPSKEVFATDKITFRKDQITQIITVLDVPLNRVSAKLVDLYRKDETPAEVFQHLELLKLSKEHYRKTGDGRPTKKDRRDLDDFSFDFDTDATEKEN